MLHINIESSREKHVAQ